MKHLLHKIKHLGAPLALITLLLLPGLGWGQYNVNFEGTGETKTAYASGTVTLSGIDWDMTEALIGTETADWKNGARSARMRGYGTSSMTMLANKSNGAGTVSFSYRRYGTESQVDWKVEYSVNDGSSWTQIGSTFTASDVVQTFSETVNVTGNVRIRIKRATESGTSNRRLNIDDISITDYTSGGSPTLTISPSSLSGFSYEEGSGPSTAQSFTISGSDLTTDISISASTNYEISETEGSGYTTPITLTQTGGTVEETTIYVRLKAGLSAGDYNNETITASSSGATDKTVTCSGSVTAPPDPEPSNHVTSFSAASPNSSTITVTWNDNNGDQPASGFLILANKTGTFTDPVDGTPQTDDEALADGTGVKNISSGVGSYSWVNLDASTQYFFRIYPYTNSGSAINYKTDGTVPEDDATTMAPSIVTYTWAGADNASWAVSANWSPVRSAPANTDVLVFNDGTTKTITAVPNQTIGQLFVVNNTIVTLQPASTGTTLSINGGTGDDLAIEAGSGLNISGANTLVISLGESATGLVSGTIALAGAAHRLISLTTNGITFNSGSVFTAGTGFTGNPFGTTSLNSIVFNSGSAYVAIAGSNPFGASTPNSVVVFQTGSLYKLAGNISPALSGRTYADFEMDVNSYAATVSGGSAGSIDNLTVTNGTLNFNMTANPGHSMKGNITVASGATLNFNPTSAGTVNLNGAAQQTITGDGTISSNSNSTLVINNASGVVLDKNVSLTGNLTITSGSVTINFGKQLTVIGTLTNTQGVTGLVIKSDDTGTGSLIHSTGNVPATVERYISGHNNVADAGWHLLGSPVAAFDIDGSSFDPGASDDFYAWQESNSTWMNHKQGTPSQIVPGTGYLVSYETSGAKTFTGALNAADQTVTVTREGAGDYAGFNLIGNPFASAITWGSGWSLGSVGGVAYVWDEATKDYIDIEAGDPIPSANGVMVYLGGEETSQSLTIPAAARIHSSQGWYKSAGGRIVLVANDPDRGAAKRSVIRFNESATEGFDLAWDGYYLRGFAPGFYSVSNGMNYSVNTLPSMNNTLVIPMGFEKTVSSGFSIELQESIPGAVVYLTDKKTGTVTNLTDNGAYHFTAAEGDDANRFTLHFGTLGMDDPSTAAPVHIYAYGGVVYLNGLDAKASVTITDLTGRVVMAERVNGNGLAMLNAGSLPKGVYVVTAVAGSRVVSAKVIL
ncbi:MAG: T9SS type A sorting domain-containing protein [Lentimicrobium sp.]